MRTIQESAFIRFPASNRPASNLAGRQRKRRHLQLCLESLESRYLMDGGGFPYSEVSADWFDSTDVGTSLVGSPLGGTSALQFIGPIPPSDAVTLESERWIVRFNESTAQSLGSPESADRLLDNASVNFDVVRGLGLPGMLLLESFSSNDQAAEMTLAANPFLSYFSTDQQVHAALTPDDPEYSGMIGLNNVGQFGSTAGADINAPSAWDVNTGSASVVVGVIDSGVDAAHPDLYLNIWINQGEIRESTRAQLQDIDDDGLFTFYDLNDPINQDLVRDLNQNSYIDAQDLLQDPLWADGIDTDQNGFVDDFFGWNFRSDPDEPFAANNPADVLGHGTHVSGTIGAIGNNGRGVTGVNWQTSIMALKFLDQQNQGKLSDAIAAINYATMMRRDFDVNVRVTNNSWGQPGGFNPALRAAIQASGDAGMLFVAAAGNGNVLGQGVDNDKTPFYPASYELDNVISVAASDADDALARFTNFGDQSVDLAAPGVGIISTLPGGRFGIANGTSMATPHVVGATALIWSELPFSTTEEVKRAILDSVQPIAALNGRVATAGRLDAAAAINADVFAPSAMVTEVEDVTVAGATTHRITVEYRHRDRIDIATVGNDDLLVVRQFGPRDQLPATLVPESISSQGNGERVTATYQITPPGGDWDALDFGSYEIQIREQAVRNTVGQSVPSRSIGSFLVRVEDPRVFYVDEFNDSDRGLTLRQAVIRANAFATPATIVLPAGTYELSKAGREENLSATGDLDVTGQLTIIGDTRESTIIDANAIDRVFHVDGGELTIERLTITGGESVDSATVLQGKGGGIVVLGSLTANDVTIADNFARDNGGGIHLENGSVDVRNSIIRDNVANTQGGGISVSDQTVLVVDRSALVSNFAFGIGGGGVSAVGDGTGSEQHEISISNTTVSGNSVGLLLLGNASLSHLSVVDNLGAGVLAFGATVDIDNSILAGNANTFQGILGDLYVEDGQLFSLGGNLVGVIGDGTNIDVGQALSGTGDAIDPSTRAFLQPLSNNRSTTPTHALLPGSRAIDNGVSLDAARLDQRGFSGEQDGDRDGISRPDSGAHENTFALLLGTVYRDENQNGFRETDEPGVAGQRIFVDLNRNGRVDAGEPTARSATDDPATQRIETGTYEIEVVSGDYTVSIDLTSGQVPMAPGTEQIATGKNPTMSGDNRFVTFSSIAGDLVPDDSNSTEDIFVRDRFGNRLERVSSPNDGSESNGTSRFPVVSHDGRYIAFVSDASNLVDSDANDRPDVFLVDRQLGTIQRISNGVDSETVASMSADGRFVTFVQSDEIFLFDQQIGSANSTGLRVGAPSPNEFTDLSGFRVQGISGDGNWIVFKGRDQGLRLHNRLTSQTQAITSQANNDTYYPVINFDGRFVAFESEATNLTASPPQTEVNLFLFDRDQDSIEQISFETEISERPFISDDGRFITFTGFISVVNPNRRNLVQQDIYVYDTSTGQTQLVSQDIDGDVPNSDSRFATISRDGTFVVFDSDAGDLTLDPPLGDQSVFVTTNPFNPGRNASDQQVSLLAGEVREVNFAAVALPGEISGTVYFDEIPNRVFDLGEAGIETTVYLDVNQNARLDVGEPSQLTAADGSYSFTGLTADTDYALSVISPQGLELIAPQDGVGAINVFLSAGGMVGDRDFGFRNSVTGGLSNDASLSGIVFRDQNGDGIRQDSEALLDGTRVFIDFNGDGIRQFDEPITEADPNGRYSLAGLGAGRFVVRPVLDPDVSLTSPAGNAFDSTEFSIRSEPGQFINLQDVIAADFNGDGSPDFATALFDANEIAIRFNHGSGQFDNAGPNVSVAPGGNGPIALAAANLNDQGSIDLIVANNLNGTATVFLDFDGSGFASFVNYEVGATPIDIATGDFDGAGGIDFVVTNEESNTVTLMLNDGNGQFTMAAAIPSGGISPTGIASGSFNQDAHLDLAIANFGNNPFGADFGNVAVLLGRGDGTFEAAVSYDVGVGPVSLASVDLNDDGHTDLAVSNFLSNTATILMGDDQGIFTVVGDQLSVGQGPIQIASEDIEGDGDQDLLVTNLLSQEVSILRNSLSRGEFQFEPAEGFGVAESEVSEQLSFDTADFDGSGTVDLVLANSFDDSIEVLLNRLVDGAYRLTLTGTEEVTNLDFGTRQNILPPSLDPIANPEAIIEDSERQTILLTGITPGRDGGRPLRVSATSSNTDLIPRVDVEYTGGSDQGTLSYLPQADSFGQSTITVTVTDPGVDQLLDTDDDGIARQSFSVRVLEVDDDRSSIILEGNGNTFSFSDLGGSADAIQLIDIRGTGNNRLVLDANVIAGSFDGGRIGVLSDSGDDVIFDDGWSFSRAFLAGDQLVRQFDNGAASLNLIGPDNFTNPMDPFDVNAKDGVTSLDALQVINELSRRAFSENDSSPLGQLRDVRAIELGAFRFYDVSRDGLITALDALRVVNRLARLSNSDAGELVIAGPATPTRTEDLRTDRDPDDHSSLSLSETIFVTSSRRTETIASVESTADTQGTEPTSDLLELFDSALLSLADERLAFDDPLN